MDHSATDTSNHFSSIPRKSQEVTAGWLSNILKMKIDEKSFTIESMNTGLGFLANLNRVKFLENCRDGTTKEHNFILKMLPTSDEVCEMVIADKLDKTEISCYTKLMPDLLEQVPSLKQSFCPVIYGGVQEKNSEKNLDYSSMLILEDLMSAGFITKEFSTQQLSAADMKLIVDFIAKLHLAGHLIETRRKTKLPKIYDFFTEWYFPNKDKHCTVHTWFRDGFGHAENVIAKYTTETNPSEKLHGIEIIEKMLKPLAPHFQKIFYEFVLAGQQFPTAIHGDLWQNNILINPETQSIKIIDWQMAGYSDPAYDLAHFVCCSLTPDITMKKVEHYVKLYFDRFQELIAEKEMEGAIPVNNNKRTWEHFWQSFKTFGFTFVFIQWVLGADIIAGNPELYPKGYQLFRFFHYDAGLTDFLTKLVS